MKRAMIVGSHGQDGKLLVRQLLAEGYGLLGIGRNAVEPWGLAEEPDAVPPFPKSLDVFDQAAVHRIVHQFAPDEIYYLAAFHHSAEAARPATADLLARSYDVHVRGLVHFLEAMVADRSKARLFYAASSHVFGNVDRSLLDETTPLNPICPYGITKTAGVHSCRLYRRQHGVFASVGFLFNHESIHRRQDFLSQKIVRAAVSIKLGQAEELVLGDLSAVVDWGDASDFTVAMQGILGLEQPDDFIVATGVPHTVEDFVATAFRSVGLDWKKHVRENRGLALTRRNPLIGDASKLRSSTGWRPKVTFEEMIDTMVRFEMGQRESPMPPRK